MSRQVKPNLPHVSLLALPIKPPAVEEKRLGREQLWGKADSRNQVAVIEKRLVGVDRLEVLIHETLHLIYPYLAEHEVERGSVLLEKVLTKEGYRRDE